MSLQFLLARVLLLSWLLMEGVWSGVWVWVVNLMQPILAGASSAESGRWAWSSSASVCLLNRAELCIVKLWVIYLKEMISPCAWLTWFLVASVGHAPMLLPVTQTAQGPSPLPGTAMSTLLPIHCRVSSLNRHFHYTREQT